jgi:hypothetical protein
VSRQLYRCALAHSNTFHNSPYDTGDRCFIDDENLVVKKMGLFAASLLHSLHSATTHSALQTLFTRVDGTETYYFNSQLFNKFMYVSILTTSCEPSHSHHSFCSMNTRRSGVRSSSCEFFIPNLAPQKQFENLTMQVAWKTPLAKLDALEKCMNEWLATEENRWFQPNTSVTLQHIDYQKYLELTIGIGHNA